MFSSIAAAALLAAFAPQALATLYITAPVEGTTCAAGANCPVTWNDDGTQPTLAAIGACTVGLYVGDQFTQFQLQPLGDVDVATQASASFVPNPQVGGNSDLYFLRFTSTILNVNGVPWEGFSAKFALTGMTGQFNATEQSLMTAPTSGAASTPANTAATTTPTGSSSSAPSSSAPGSTTIITTTTAKPTSSASSAKASSSPTTSTSGALPAVAGSSSVVVGFAAVAVSAFFAAFAI